MVRNLKELSLEELGAWLASQGEPSYRARQILRWVYQRGAVSLAEMSDLSKTLRERLAESFEIARPRLVRLARAQDRTRKLLFGLADGARIESVLIPAESSDR